METLKCVSTNKDSWREIIGTKNGCQDVVVLSKIGTCQFCRNRDQINQSADVVSPGAQSVQGGAGLFRTLLKQPIFYN